MSYIDYLPDDVIVYILGPFNHNAFNLTKSYNLVAKLIGKDNIFRLAAEIGNVELLAWSHCNNYYWDHTLYQIATDNGCLPIMQYAYRNNCPWHELETAKRCEFGEEEVEKWFEPFGYKRSNIDVLSWASSQNFITNSFSLFTTAARNGHLHILKWLYKVGYGRDWKACSDAKQNNHFCVVRWIHKKRRLVLGIQCHDCMLIVNY